MEKKTASAIMLTLLLTSMLTFAFNIQSVEAESLPLISLNPIEYTAPLQTMYETFAVDINITDVTDLGGFEFKIGYNTTILDAVYVYYTPITENCTNWIPVDAEGVWHPDGPPTINDTIGYVWVGAEFPFGQEFTGNGTLVTIIFTATEIGNCTLDLYDTVLVDASGDPIDHSSLDGFVQAKQCPPEPYIAHPLNCSLIYGNETEIRVDEMRLATNIVSTIFEYSSDGLNWTTIDVDYDFGDGWRTLWNLTDLSEGGYYIRATMMNNLSKVGEDLVHVYFDPWPPIPEMTELDFPTILSGIVDLAATTLGHHVNYTEFWVYNECWLPCTLFGKSVANLCQLNIDDAKKPILNDPFKGEFSSGPTAAASCLAYWDSYKDSTGKRPYDNLYDENPKKDIDGDKVPDGLEEMARYLYKQAGTNQPPWKGTFSKRLADAINTYIYKQKLDAELEACDFRARTQTPERPGGITPTLKDLIKEFLRCQDVIAQFTCPGPDETLGTNDDYGHYVTISAIHIYTLQKTVYLPPPYPMPIITMGLDLYFMDPATGKERVGEIDVENNRVQSDWNRNGRIGKDEFAKLSNMVTVCPVEIWLLPPKEEAPKWVPLGTDFDGSDGWSVNWDTTQLPDAFYLVKSTMTDATNNTGTDIILVYINNARITDITPTKTVVAEGTPIDIQVSVENMFVGSAFFNITLYGNETLIGTENALLPSQTSTTLVFTWDTYGLPKGDYVISANASVLLNETYLTHITYIDGDVLVTSPPPLSVSISPLSASILIGQSVTFTSTVHGGYTPYSYQWYLNGAPVSGATSNTWTFTPTTSEIYYIYLKVTDAKANTAQSETARITVATVPVGGYSFPIQVHTKTEPVLPYIALVAILTAIFTKVKPKTRRKR